MARNLTTTLTSALITTPSTLATSLSSPTPQTLQTPSLPPSAPSPLVTRCCLSSMWSSLHRCHQSQKRHRHRRRRQPPRKRYPPPSPPLLPCRPFHLVFLNRPFPPEYQPSPTIASLHRPSSTLSLLPGLEQVWEVWQVEGQVEGQVESQEPRGGGGGGGGSRRGVDGHGAFQRIEQQ